MMKKLIRFPLYLVMAALCFFVVTFTMYIFNLDMKLMAMIAPLLEKWYDSREHDTYL